MQAGTTLFERFRVVSLLGAGGMGVVYRATDLLLGSDVAVKLLHADLATDPTARTRLKAEVTVARTLRDPHIVAVYDYFEDERAGQAGFSMELLAGTSLEQRLAAGDHESRLAASRGLDRLVWVSQLASQVGAALDHIHQHGLVHRDVTPANVVLDEQVGPDGTVSLRVRLTDFGIAFAGGGPRLTAAGVSGRLGYIAPELQTGTAKPTPAADIWSFGLLLYHALTGVAEIPTLDMPPPSSRVPGLPAEVDQAVMSCFRRAETRPATASLVAETLRRSAAGTARTVPSAELAGSFASGPKAPSTGDSPDVSGSPPVGGDPKDAPIPSEEPAPVTTVSGGVVLLVAGVMVACGVVVLWVLPNLLEEESPFAPTEPFAEPDLTHSAEEATEKDGASVTGGVGGSTLGDRTDAADTSREPAPPEPTTAEPEPSPPVMAVAERPPPIDLQAIRGWMGTEEEFSLSEIAYVTLKGGEGAYLAKAEFPDRGRCCWEGAVLGRYSLELAREITGTSQRVEFWVKDLDDDGVSEVFERHMSYAQGVSGATWVIYQLNGWTPEVLLQVGPIEVDGCDNFPEEGQDYDCFRRETEFQFQDIDGDGDQDVIVSTIETTFQDDFDTARLVPGTEKTTKGEQRYEFSGNRLLLVQ